MVANLFAVRVSCVIGSIANQVDYSNQLISADLAYSPLSDGAAGGAMPFGGTLELGDGGSYNPINCRSDFALFAEGTPVNLQIELSGAWYSLPPLFIMSANYRSDEAKATISVGDQLQLNQDNPQYVDSRAADISIGGIRSGAATRSRLLVKAGVGNIFSEYTGNVTFRHPRNLGNNYIEAAGQIANSEGLVFFTTPSGQLINREVMTLAATATTPVIGTYRYGIRDAATDQFAINRHVSQFNEIAISGSLANRYTGTAEFNQIFATLPSENYPDSEGVSVQVSRNFSAARVTTTTTTTELGSNIYAGISGMPSGNVTSQTVVSVENYKNNSPGVIEEIKVTTTARVAKVAKSLLGWYASKQEESETNNSGAVTALPFSGSSWSSNITVSEITTTYEYDPSRPDVPISETVVEKLAGIAIFDGLTSGVPWDSIISSSPIGLSSLTTARIKKTRWIEQGKGIYSIVITEKALNALGGTGDRSAVIGGLQGAEEEESPPIASTWLNSAIRMVSLPSIVTPASRNNAPPAPKLKPPRYTAEGASTLVELSYSYLSSSVTKDIYKTASPPFVSDESGDAFGFSAAKANLTSWLNKIARLDRMRRQGWELVTPIYPEMLQNFGGWFAIDIYHAPLGETFRVILNGPGVRISQGEAAIFSSCITLGRFNGGALVQPFQQQQ